MQSSLFFFLYLIVKLSNFVSKSLFSSSPCFWEFAKFDYPKLTLIILVLMSKLVDVTEAFSEATESTTLCSLTICSLFQKCSSYALQNLILLIPILKSKSHYVKSKLFLTHASKFFAVLLFELFLLFVKHLLFEFYLTHWSSQHFFFFYLLVQELFVILLKPSSCFYWALVSCLHNHFSIFNLFSL